MQNILESITIPDSVTSIGYRAFEYCYSLKEIHFLGTKEQWEALGLDADDINNATVTPHPSPLATPSPEGEGKVRWLLKQSDKQ